jgi:hypothetical protein
VNRDSSVGIVTVFLVADQFKLVDYKAAEPRTTWKSAIYVRGFVNEAIANRQNFMLLPIFGLHSLDFATEI